VQRDRHNRVGFRRQEFSATFDREKFPDPLGQQLSTIVFHPQNRISKESVVFAQPNDTRESKSKLSTSRAAVGNVRVRTDGAGTPRAAVSGIAEELHSARRANAAVVVWQFYCS